MIDPKTQPQALRAPRHLTAVEAWAEAARMAEAFAGPFASSARMTTTAWLQRIVDLSRDSIGAVDGASVSAIVGRTPVTPVWTHPRVAAIDALQYETQEGPCLDAMRKRAAFYAADLRDDARWPSFGPKAARSGMRSLLSFSLGGDEVRRSLNLYARSPSAYGEVDRARAATLAHWGGLMLGLVERVEVAEREAASSAHSLDRVMRALPVRGVINRAIGMIMHRDDVGAEEAFARLRRSAQQTNTDLRQAARVLTERGAGEKWIDRLGSS